MSRRRRELPEEAADRWPGAARPASVAGESAVGAFIVLISLLPLLTVALGLAIATRALVRFLGGDRERLPGIRADLRAGWLGSLGVGALFWLLVLVLTLDITVASNADLPFASVVLWLGWIGLVVAVVCLVVAAGAWTPELRWRGAVRSTPGALAADPLAALFVALAVVITGVLAWVYLPLALLGLVGLVFSSTVLVVRRLERGERD